MNNMVWEAELSLDDKDVDAILWFRTNRYHGNCTNLANEPPLNVVEAIYVFLGQTRPLEDGRMEKEMIPKLI